MPEIFFDPVDSIVAGAIGEAGKRVFLVQATSGSATLTVVLEKQQVALLAERLSALLAQAAREMPEDVADVQVLQAAPLEDLPPLFRAVALGIGFDPNRRMAVIELHERADAGMEAGEESGSERPEPGGDESGDIEAAHVARLFMTRNQVRALVGTAAAAVQGGRPICGICQLPMDPNGHACAGTNGHRKH